MFSSENVQNMDPSIFGNIVHAIFIFSWTGEKLRVLH